MLIRTRLFIAALLVCSMSSFTSADAQKFSVKPDNGGVIISWENLHCGLQQSGRLTRVSLQSKYAFSEFTTNTPAIQSLRFVIAVPGDGTNTSLLQSIITQKVGKVQLACSSLSPDSVAPASYCSLMSVSPSAIVRYAGMRRGVPLAEVIICPFNYDASTNELTLAVSGAINIRFDSPLGKTLNLEKTDSVFYGDVMNPTQITSKRGAIKKVGEKTLAPDEWYNPATTYVRLATTRDGVALITGKDIIAASPSWSGKPTANLTLLHNGLPYPFAAIDSDGLLSAADTFYFVGRRTSGDTTFIDYVTGEEPFFLTLGTTPSTARLLPMEVLQATDSVQTVNLSLHIEEDHDFSWGAIVGSPGTSSYDSENFSTGKGFFWKVLLSDSSSLYSTLRTTFRLLPSRNPDDFLTVTAKYYTFTDNITSDIDYHVQLYANGDPIAMQEAAAFDYYRINNTLQSPTLFSGLNSLSLVNLPLFGSLQTTLTVDYFTVTGRVRPVAWHGIANFSVPLRSTSANLSVPGFSHGRVVAIDTASGTYSVIQGTAGTFVASGANSKELSVTVNDSISSSTESGLLLAAALPDGSFIIRHFDVNSPDAATVVNSLPDGSSIATAYNAAQPLSSQLRSFFTAQGAKADVVGGTVWACILRKNIAGTVKEQLSDAVATVDNFYVHSGGNNFRTDITLPASGESPILLYDSEAIERIIPTPVVPSELRSKPINAEVVIITHSEFEQGAKRLATYRRTQGYSVEVVRVEDTYTEFTYGKKSPFAIKKYLQFLTAQNGKSPAYLILFGDASWDPRRMHPYSNQTDYVPSYGFPVTDFWYGLMDNDNEYDIIVGRLPAHTLQDANDVVDKLIEYDTLSARPWMRKFFFLSGGDGEGQQNTFYNFFDLARETVLNYPVCIDTVRLRRNPGGAVDQSLAISVRNTINEGVSWVNFWGHGAPEVFDVDGWQVNTLTNRARYNVLTTFSCQTGAFANPFSESRNEGYVMAAGKGSIAAFGNTATGSVDIDQFMSFNLFQAIRDGERLLGQILYHAKGGLGHNPEYRVAQQQFGLIGDPLTRFVLDSVPDLYILDSDVKIESTNGSSFISESDSLARVRVFVRNVGIHLDDIAPVRLIHRFNNKADTLVTTVQDICAGAEVEFLLPIGGRPGRHDITIEIDPDHSIIEGKRGGNTYITSFDVLTGGVQALDPLPLWDVAADKPIFRFVRPEISTPLRFECELWNKTMSEKLGSIATTETSNEMTIHEAFVEWQPQGISLTPGSGYIVRARTVNTITSYPSGWLTIPFRASGTTQFAVSSWQQSGSTFWTGTAVQSLLSDASGGLTLLSRNIPISISTCGGGQGLRHSRIIFGNQEYIERPSASGFGILHLSPFDSIGKFREYAGFYTAQNDPLLMGNSDAIVRYLRDSVQTGETVVISVSDGGFNGFMFSESGKDGDTASFLAAMRTYGAVLADTILRGNFYSDGKPIPPEDRYRSGYSMIGVKGGITGSAIERAALYKDTITISDSILYYEKKGEAVSPLIGPATKWGSASFHISMLDSGATATVRIIGHKRNTGEEVVLAEVSSAAEIQLGTISAQEFPYLQCTAALERIYAGANPSLQSWNVNFTPAPEFAVLKNAAVLPDSVLRGESAEYSATVRNIARRVDADTSSVQISALVESGAGSPQEFRLPLPRLVPDEETTLKTVIQSRSAGTITGITAIADPAGVANELYRFNNKRRTTLDVGEDHVPPSIEVFADGRRVTNGDVVAPETQFDIIIHDNSLLPIDSVNLRIRLNRFIQPDTNTQNATFQHITDNGTARARLSFFSRKTLEVGENILSVIAEDATANSDTLRLTLVVVLNGSVNNIAVTPNPVTTSGDIHYNYKGQLQDAPVTIKIFNLTGKQIRTLTGTARIGNNATMWDGRDDDGTDVPPGLYVFVLNIAADSYIEPQAGRLMLVR